ncbi:MAG: alpha/beta hydrolase [Synechococcaceae cyanobacterium]|nr:alpha/beta hydrolase [Synechococcaceae cyanobacterium]
MPSTNPSPNPSGPPQPGLSAAPSDVALKPPVQVIAMHGWGGDSRGWDPWLAATAGLGWSWSCGERGYGQLAPRQPSWQPRGRRLLIGHSMGPLLVTPALLAEAELVVLLASFSRFVPPGSAGRRLQTAIQGMGQRLEPHHPFEPEEQQARRARELLQEFLVQAAAPAPAPLLPVGPADRPIGAAGRALLRHDLQRLASCRDLPDGFPEQRPVLIVEAGCDRIVSEESRALLRQRLPQAARLVLPEAGHALLDPSLIPAVLEWVQGQLSP